VILDDLCNWNTFKRRCYCVFLFSLPTQYLKSLKPLVYLTYSIVEILLYVFLRYDFFPLSTKHNMVLPEGWCMRKHEFLCEYRCPRFVYAIKIRVCYNWVLFARNTRQKHKPSVDFVGCINNKYIILSSEKMFLFYYLKAWRVQKERKKFEHFDSGKI